MYGAWLAGEMMKLNGGGSTMVGGPSRSVLCRRAAGISYCRSAARGGAAMRATATEPTELPWAFFTSAKLISM
jgi:hypothetical protein